ncbi:MAG: hypothetical protein ACJ74O_19975 [Frankiaceae bacterium]
MTQTLGTGLIVHTYSARRAACTVACGFVVGALMAVLWSFTLVDDTIGDNVASTLLGHDAGTTAISGAWAGVVFAIVSGFAGTFTACNIAVFGSLPALLEAGPDRRTRIASLLAPVRWLLTGAALVSAPYGAIGVALGHRIPQLSTATVGDGFPVRLLQASVVFGVLGLCFVYLGLGAARLVPDPIARLERRFPHARLVVLGALIGGFLIGRPFPLFHKMFEHAVDTHDVAYGAVVLLLQSIGNIVVVSLLFLLLAALSGGRVQRWMARRAGSLTSAAFVMVGTFSILYWVVRVPAAFGYGWFPTMPWS